MTGGAQAGLPRVAVVGAGVAGLAAALALRGRAEVTLVEASGQVGGKLRTTPLCGLDVEEGAESFLARVPDGVRFAGDVGLAGDVVHPATSAAGLLVGGRLRPLPGATLLGVPLGPRALLELARGGVLPPGAAARAALDLVLPRTPQHGDPAVGAYVGARMGRAVVERLVDPLLGGVYAGRADHLSLAATVPALAPVAAGERSLLRGARAAVPRPAPGRGGAGGPGGPGGPAPVFAAVRGGMGRLAAAASAAARRGGAQIVLGTTVRALERRAGGWRLVSGDPRAPGSLEVDAVVLAVPGVAARRLLAGPAPRAAAELADVPYASVALVALVYRDGPLPAGSGFLVPAREHRTIKAATFLTNKWPQVAADSGLSVVRASVGRFGDDADLARPDAELAGVAAAEVSAATGFLAAPVATRVSRWGGGLPQYLPGHPDRVLRLRAALPAGLAVCGAAYDGVGIPACIRSGEAAAETVTGHLAGRLDGRP